jgi:alpha-2-macroglobulin
VRPEELQAAASIVPKDSASSFGGGDLVLADLVVVAPSPRQFVVIDDPLPAGLEPVDTRLSTTGASLDVEGMSQPPSDDEPGARDDRIATGSEYLSSVVRREMRDDRVLFFVEHLAAGMYHYRYLARATTFGTFVVPPTRAEEMYTPEVFGRSAALTVEVRGGPR